MFKKFFLNRIFAGKTWETGLKISAACLWFATKVNSILKKLLFA